MSDFHKPKCNNMGCENKVTWLVGGQWYMCDEHVEEAIMELREHVNPDINAVSLIDKSKYFIISEKQLKTIGEHHISGKEWETTQEVLKQSHVGTKQLLDKILSMYIKENNTGECPFPNNEPTDCDTDGRCGLCVLEKVIGDICKECDDNERTATEQ